MVTFTLIEEGKQFIIYPYYPNGDKTKGAGIIVVDKERSEKRRPFICIGDATGT